MCASAPRETPPLSNLLYGVVQGLICAVALLSLLVPASVATGHLGVPYRRVEGPQHAVLGAQHVSRDARKLAEWIAATGDNKQLDFLVIDKQEASLYVFDATARFVGATRVLLGAARGDDTVPGIGTRAIAAVQPQERTTPAGRFLAERGHDARGEDVVWVDYEAAVSIHRVLTTNPREHRLARLASPNIADRRISYGCINVPVAFYESRIRPIFATRRAWVYILPEVKSVVQVFQMHPTTWAATDRPG